MNVYKIDKVIFLQKDLKNPFIYEEIISYFSKKIDLVISDIAANTTGNKNLDSYRTGELCLKSMELAKKVLHQEGIFLSKIRATFFVLGHNFLICFPSKFIAPLPINIE